MALSRRLTAAARRRRLFALMINIISDQERRGELLLALADGTRGRIVEMLAGRPHTASEIHRAFPIAAPAVSRHLRVLREAGLIEERRPDEDKRVRLYILRPEPMQEVAGWLEEVSRAWQQQLDSFKDYVGLRTGRPVGKR
jgi:DNA-binding transcriptional ArsR family regulator